MTTIILITSQQRLNGSQNLDAHHRFFLSKPLINSLPQQRKLCVILSFGYSTTDIDIYYKWTYMVAKG